MGVTGLWKLIEPSGKPVPVETLEGKILAVDISIWLHQVVKGFQDNKGAALNNAHLLGLFHRLCKLMYYRVKPVFVFDGCVPQLKIETISRRQQQRSKLNNEACRIQALLLQSLAKEKVVQQALGPNADFLLTSPIKKLLANKSSRKEDTVDDMFKLPELPSGSKSSIKGGEIETTDDSLNESSFYTEDYTGTSSSADDSSLDESNLRNVYNKNLQTINVKSKEFLQLPADIRHEILVDIKETRKQSSWGRLHELPSRSDDFSNFQMKRLLKRRDVQVSLEAAEQEMGGRTLTYAELTNIFSEEGILETDIVEKGTKQISSDEHTRFLLVKDLKKKFSQIKEEPIKEEMNDIKQDSCAISSINSNSGDIPSSSKIVFKNESNDTNLGNEYDADLELAIALSLEDNKVYDDKDYDYDSGESLKLTKAQRQQLQNAAKGPARSYMIEYGGMNKEEVVGIMEKTQSNEDFDDTDLEIERLINTDTNEKVEAGKLIDDTSKEAIANSESQDIRLYVTDDSDATISDLEEVKDIDETDVKTVIKRANKSNENVSEFVKVEDKGEVVSALEKYNENNDTDSELEEVKDSDLVELETCRTKNMGVLANKPIEKHNDIDECVIEETPPLLQEKEELKPRTSKTLNIEIDLNEPLKPEDDLFADIFEDIETHGEIIKETPTSVKDTGENEKLEPLMFNEIKTEVQMKTPLLSILDDLKKQADEIKNIKLENIKFGESVIEISDDKSGLKATKTKNEIIEICDRDDNTECLLTPPLQLTGSANHSPKIQSTSPKLKTPSKNHSITEFFDVNYVVKRTPDNSICEEKEVPKIKSPFFIRKSHKSGHKSGSNSPSSNNKLSKANKNLFGQDNGNSSKDRSENNVATLKELTFPNEEDILNEAANLLKTQKTEEELNAIALNLAKKREELENERNRQDRMGMSITQRMNADCQELLRLFGVPFIVAPMEAEAQCAFLNIAQLTHGTITDDSDIWLFGGRTVYKNFFAQNKHVMEFNSEQIEKDFNCDRKKLIQLACLVGSDYTTGISGIGAVTALEILASFTPKEYNNTDNSTSPMQSILVTLQKFRNWWLSYKSGGVPPGSSARLALQKKLKNIELHEGFPNTAVIEAYLIPKVDESKEAFTWGYPDVESIREFARKTFGWTTSKTDDILKPVLKKIEERRTQKSIRNYFNVKSSLSLRQIKISKRVQNAIEKMTGNIVSDDDTPEKPTKPKRTRKTNTTSTTTAGKKQKETIGKTKALDKLSSANEFNLNIEACNSDQVARGPLKRAVKRINLTETKQREKDLAQMEANKKLAIEIFQNASKEHKRKRKA